MEDETPTLFARGLAKVVRDRDALFLYFSGIAGTPDFRVALHETGAQKMLEELRSLVRLLESPVDQSSPTSGHH